MYITELLARATHPLVSYEIIPPLRGASIQPVMDTIEQLIPFEPPFIDVTGHSAEVYYDELPDGTIRRRVKRKRPGTIGLCAAIQSRFRVEAVPHLLCHGFTRDETEDALIELHYLGIQNVMALYGDDHGSRPLRGRSDATRNVCAAELVTQIAAMNRGCYLEPLVNPVPTDFCIGVAGYPEKHFEAPNQKWDIAQLKHKVDAGAHYIITQMFFDNRYYFDFAARCREAGIHVPIIPGLKILSSVKQLRSIPHSFHVEIPEALTTEIEAARPEQVADIGVAWTMRQGEELLNAGVPCLHFYTMTNSNFVARVVKQLRKML